MRKLTKEEFITRAKLIHNNKYNYSLVDYKNNYTKVFIICPTHGIFQQKPNGHLNGKGCLICSGNYKSGDGFLKKAKNISYHQLKQYDYSKFIYVNAHTKGIIICPEHGEFLQIPTNHLRGKGCPKCNTSKGENCIESFLNNNNIKYIRQYTIDMCRNKKPLRFDFYLPQYSIIVEFQGEQHFQAFKYFGGTEKFMKIQHNDKIKKEYCQQNNICFVEITYKDNIELKLSELLTRRFCSII